MGREAADFDKGTAERAVHHRLGRVGAEYVVKVKDLCTPHRVITPRGKTMESNDDVVSLVALEACPISERGPRLPN